MTEPAKIVHFARCACCGALTFIDLLDEYSRCEYCKETKKKPRPEKGRTKPKGRGHV